MIFGIGVDIVNNERIYKLYEKYGDKFLDKIYIEQEKIYCQKRHSLYECLSARFSLKEAFIKALSIKPEDNFFPIYKDIGIIGSAGYKKDIVISDKIKNFLLSKGIKKYKFWFSISHIDNFSIGFVIIEKF